MIALDWIALSLAKGIGLRGYWRLIHFCGHPTKVLETPLHVLHEKYGLHQNQCQALRDVECLRSQAKLELQRLEQIGAGVLSFESPLYPSLLKEISDPPPVLYFFGNQNFLRDPCLAIVGSRASSSYGRRVAKNFAADCARHHLAIVSGLALGIDASAHEGALSVHGKTIAVLGCGLDVIYPPQNIQLTQKIRQQGLVITEYPMRTKPDAFRFPARNRIIAGMSCGVVVVEAAKKSGSLITAQMALDFGREVFAVPGQVDSPKSVGTHWLLQQGAKLVQRSDDIIEELQIDLSSQPEQEESFVQKMVSEKGEQILKYLDAYPVSKDKIIEDLRLSPEELSHQLLLLELEDIVELLPGDMVRKL